jgi:hypothetical protein
METQTPSSIATSSGDGASHKTNDELTSASAAVVSAFGRGHWIARELARAGWTVTLLETTPHMGAWDPVDWETPFGLFDTESLLATQRQQWFEEAATVEVASGFTLWLKNALFEGRGPLVDFFTKKFQISDEVRSYLFELGIQPTKRIHSSIRKLQESSFQNNWLAQLAHQLASSVYQENHRALSSGCPLPVYAPWIQRTWTAASFEASLKACERDGVRVLRAAKIGDVRVEGRDVVELRLVDHGTAIAAKSFIWTLTSEETTRFSESLQKSLFPAGVIKPEWCWLRYRFGFKAKTDLLHLPEAFVLLGSLQLPWTHGNLAVARKLSSGSDVTGFDVWIRQPAHFRFAKAYIHKLGQELLEEWARRFPMAEPFLQNYPAEEAENLAQLGAPRLPVFQEQVMDQLKPAKIRNLFFDSSEQWGALDSLSQFHHQTRIFARLKELKVAWDAAALKKQGARP